MQRRPARNPAAAHTEVAFAADIEVVRASEMTPALVDSIVELCDLAYDEDLAELFALYRPEGHVIIRSGERLLSHGMWVTRWLAIDDDPPIATGYVEFVATLPAAQGRGLGGALMRRIVEELRHEYRLAALSPAISGFYERLGWHYWEGPLAIREPSGALVPSPNDEVMIYWLGDGPWPDVTRTLSIEWREGEVW